MLIQSNIITAADLYRAMRDAGIEGVYIDVRRSGKGRHTTYSHDVTLYTYGGHDAEGKARNFRKNTGKRDGYGNAYNLGDPDVRAATYREHGWWMVKLFDLDPTARVSGYKGVADFHAQTRDAFTGDRVNA